ncbi:MAG TPA: GNAT family N-acetyltransferase [Ktedonobacteraceae bacterium]|nr:GNAT family N-acetyltransferase [Ktedonobacteraceae bacterium]
MIDESSNALVMIRVATLADIETIEKLDNYSSSPTRDIHREMEKYFGSVDPSTHEQTIIFLAEINNTVVGKAELMVPPTEASTHMGYIKRVIVDPEYRKHGLARRLMQHIINYARSELQLQGLDLHVWDENHSAVNLYESLGFQVKHRELYLRLPF